MGFFKILKKIVVFVDDLDRCAPDKILEVLESTKVFLDIKGFVYVLGMNSEVVNKAIDQKYKDMGIKGEDYLEKIIQIPFKIPDWIELDLGEYLDYLIEKEIDPDYKDTFKEYKDLVLKVIEKTPRQVKRFINTYISEHEVFKGKKLDKTIHLILTILKFKWYDFYRDLFYESYRNYLKELLKDETKLREEFKDKKDLVDFISERKVRETLDTILGMDDGELLEYRRAGMSIPQKIIKPTISKETLLELLSTGKITEFNEITKDLENIDLSRADLRGADLCETNLRRANLRGADLSGTDLRGTDLRGADLSWTDLSWTDLRLAILSDSHLRESDLSKADLRGTDLREADLSKANLSKANLIGANLSKANLIGANLSKANLIGANLSKADLSKADLSSGVILFKRSEYQETKVEGADFTNVILNDAAFVKYLRENKAYNVPEVVANNVAEIIEMLRSRGYNQVVLDYVNHFFGTKI